MPVFFIARMSAWQVSQVCVAGEVDGPGGDLGDGGAAIVAVLAKGLGHDEVANHEKHHEGEDEQKGKPEEMS